MTCIFYTIPDYIKLDPKRRVKKLDSKIVLEAFKAHDDQQFKLTFITTLSPQPLM